MSCKIPTNETRENISCCNWCQLFTKLSQKESPKKIVTTIPAGIIGLHETRQNHEPLSTTQSHIIIHIDTCMYTYIFIFIYMYKHTTRTHIQILPLSSSLSKSTNNRTPPFTTIQTTKKRTPKHKIHPFSNGFFCQVAIPASNWKHLHRNHSRHDPHHAPPCGSPPGAAYRERAWSLPHKWGQKQRRSFFGGDMFS